MQITILKIFCIDLSLCVIYGTRARSPTEETPHSNLNANEHKTSNDPKI